MSIDPLPNDGSAIGGELTKSGAGAEGGPAAPAPAPTVATPSMGSLVTPHAQISVGPSEWQLLATGFDSVYLGINVEWKGDFSKFSQQLFALKEE